ncbi:MAG: M3 family oligoendopeptidase [Thermoleophilia bacterium]|nr:M3 family oligoendopeptidase [Thermoleophilia bacterium]
MATGAEHVSWDLSDLYAGDDDPALEADLEDVRAAAARFRERYRGRVGELDAADLAEAVAELERIEAARVRVRSFAYMHFSEDTEDPARGALLQRAQEWLAALETELLFFTLEWTALADERAAPLLAAGELEHYAHFLRSLRRYRPHLLSEPEERIIAEKAVSGRTAWARLNQELLSSLRVRLDDGARSLDDALSRLQSADRDERRAVAAAVTEALEPGLRTRTSAFNAVLLDKAIDDRLRAYPHWLADRNLDNEVDDEVVDTLIDAVVGRYDIPRRFYALKAKLLGLPRLAHWDRYAPVTGPADPVSWSEARDLVLEAFHGFSAEVGGTIERFFDGSWIDAGARPGKVTGAYCMTRIPDVHPYVLMNFTGDRRSVLTLAHELGHGLHGVLAAEAGVLNSQTPLTLAETASVFAEALTFGALRQRDDDPRRRLDLLIGRIDDAIATVFRQIALNRFEDAVHRERREAGELSPDRFGELWLETQGALLGDVVELGDDYRPWWSYIGHFALSPGYVYAYAFGYLFSLAIFRRYEREGEAMVEPYLRLLRAGGSDAPERLAAIVGLDVRARGLWDDGLAAIDDVVTEAEGLAATL